MRARSDRSSSRLPCKASSKVLSSGIPLGKETLSLGVFMFLLYSVRTALQSQALIKAAPASNDQLPGDA